jgi:hypothetical protein
LKADKPKSAKPRTAAPMSPGDEAPAGTSGTGEDICPECGGDGSRDGAECRECAGTGRVVRGVGGA